MIARQCGKPTRRSLLVILLTTGGRWQTYSFKRDWAGIKMSEMNLEIATNVDENMKPEVLEAGLSVADRLKILESKARFIQYLDYYYFNITCRGDGIPKLIKL